MRQATDFRFLSFANSIAKIAENKINLFEKCLRQVHRAKSVGLTKLA